MGRARRSYPALDSNDHAAPEAQFRAHEFTVLDETLTHNGQRSPKLLILVTAEIHVINNEDTAVAKCRHRPAQLEDLSTRCVWEHQVELTKMANDLGSIT